MRGKQWTDQFITPRITSDVSCLSNRNVKNQFGKIFYIERTFKISDTSIRKLAKWKATIITMATHRQGPYNYLCCIFKRLKTYNCHQFLHYFILQ